MLPTAAKEYQKKSRTEVAAVVAAIRRQWRKMGADFDASWAMIEPTIADIVSTGQVRSAREASAYIPNVLEDTGQTRAIPAAAGVRPEAFGGYTGSGAQVGAAMYASVIVAKAAVRDGFSQSEALRRGGVWLSQNAGMAVSDAGRLAERTGMAVRPIGGYVRLLELPSCSRCVILAGKRYKSEVAFQRHPRCDCRHAPASDEVADDLIDSPQAYFDSLSKEEQDKTFTKAGAEAIRNGADMNQVVNARRGMYTTAQGTFTREGVTRRGFYGSSRGATTPNGRARRRLMPEQIQAVAKDKDDYLRLLRLYRFI